MLALMQNWPLTTDKIIDHAARSYGAAEIIGEPGDGSTRRSSYAELRDGAARLSGAVLAPGIGHGTRVATLAMNGIDHLHCWYAISGIGAVCHTLNPRLAPDQLAWMIDHAEDRLLFADAAFAPLVAQILARCPTVERVVWLEGDGSAVPGPPSATYDAFLPSTAPWRAGAASTRTRLRGFATRRARPASPRACATRIDRTSCMR